MYRRKLCTLAGVTLSLWGAGCVGSDRSGNAAATQTPDEDHAIEIENPTTESVEMTVTVRRVSTETVVHDQTHTVQPEETATIYNTRQADPDGIEEFNLSVATNGSTDSLRMKTNECWGDVVARVSASDGVSLVYAIC
jgi:hypothetical protein